MTAPKKAGNVILAQANEGEIKAVVAKNLLRGVTRPCVRGLAGFAGIVCVKD